MKILQFIFIVSAISFVVTLIISTIVQLLQKRKELTSNDVDNIKVEEKKK